jgi:hypothetical protein
VHQPIDEHLDYVEDLVSTRKDELVLRAYETVQEETYDLREFLKKLNEKTEKLREKIAENKR